MTLLLTLYTYHIMRGIFSVPIVNLEQIKYRLCRKSHRSKNHDITLLLFVRNAYFIIVRDELRTFSTSKLVLLCENSLQLKLFNNFGKKLYFKIYYRVLHLFRISFQIHFLLAVLLLVYSIN